jgi:hypothetical protein
MTPPIEYTLHIDTRRDGTYSAALDNITGYLFDAQWNNGMSDAYQEVAPPANLTVQLANHTGAFYQEILGNELLVNGNFSAWSGDDPTGWTVTGESGSDPEVSQVGVSEGHGGTDTGAANLYTTSGTVSISQSALVAGLTYQVSIRITKVTTGGVVVYCGNTPVSPPYQLEGYYSFTFNATDATLKIQNHHACDVTIDDVSVRQTALYSGLLRRGILMRLQATYQGETRTLFIGKISKIQPTAGASVDPIVTVTASDPMNQLLNTEYAPPLLTDVTVDEALTAIFDAGIIRWPYGDAYWLLEIQGASELDETTTLYDHDVTNFDTGKTELEFAGDVADRGQGVDAQNYIRDLVAAEAGGRAFFDARTAKFIFHNRHRDPTNDTVVASYDAGDYESPAPVYGDDIINRLTLNFTARQIGDPNTVIWTMTNVPIRIGAGAVKNVIARYTDSTNTERRIGAKDFIPPVVGSHFIANTEEDGSGDDASSSLSVSVNEQGATSARLTLENDSAADFYITHAELRGTPLLWSEETVEVLDGDSSGLNDLLPQTRDVRALGDAELAQAYAEYIVNKFKNPISRFASIAFDSLRSHKMALASLDVLIGDKITVADAHTNHSQNYIVVGETHHLFIGGDHPRDVTWILKPVSREMYWKLEVPGQGELGQTTILAF